MRRRLEHQLAQLGQIEPARRRGDAARPGQRMGDGRAHVGRGQMRQGGAVVIGHQAMHDGLGMHQHVQLFRRQREQEMRLDQFQPLVHQGGAVDRNLARPSPSWDGRPPVPPWRPRICSSGHSRNGPPEAVMVTFSTSPASPEPSTWKIALCSESTGMTERAGSLQRVAEHRARRHHAFLVGQRHDDAALDRGQRRLDRGGAHDRHHHEIGRHAPPPSITASRPAADFDAGAGQPAFSSPIERVIADHGAAAA